MQGRVRAAIGKLRRLGLAGVLVRRATGYLFDEHVEVRLLTAGRPRFVDQA